MPVQGLCRSPWTTASGCESFRAVRVTIFDRRPGQGLGQWLLMASWAVGCWLQKTLGLVDEYHGASSWADAVAWLDSRPGKLSSVQYWGHGSPAGVWLADELLPLHLLDTVKAKLDPTSIVWFRTCSTFQGGNGQGFAQFLANRLGCTVAGHTRIIGLFQGGLHTLRPGAVPSWSVDEGELSGLPAHLFPVGDHVIFCLTTRIPDGW